MANYSPLFKNDKPHFHTSGGELAVGYGIYTYYAGTNTPVAMFSDPAGTTQYENPIVLDSRGEPSGQGIYANVGNKYKVILKDPNGATVWSMDDVSPMPEEGGGGGGSGLSEVAHDETMTGNGTPESPLSVVFPLSNGVKFKGRFTDSVGYDFDSLPTITIDNIYDRNYRFQLIAPSLYQRISECNECFVLFYFGAHLWTETPPTIDLNSCDLGSVRCEIEPNGAYSQFAPEIVKQVALPQIQGISSGDYKNFCDLSVDAVLYRKNNDSDISDIRLAFRSVPDNIVGAKIQWMYEALVFEC